MYEILYMRYYLLKYSRLCTKYKNKRYEKYLYVCSSLLSVPETVREIVRERVPQRVAERVRRRRNLIQTLAHIIRDTRICLLGPTSTHITDRQRQNPGAHSW